MLWVPADKGDLENGFPNLAPWPVALWSCAFQEPGQRTQVPLAILGKLIQVPVEPVAALGDPSLVPAAHPYFSEYSPQEWDKMRVVAGGRFEGSGIRL